MGGFPHNAPSAPLLSALRCHHYKRPAQDSYQPPLPRSPSTLCWCSTEGIRVHSGWEALKDVVAGVRRNL